MGLFDFLKKKKDSGMELEIPPPPEGLEEPGENESLRPISDFEPISAKEEHKELPAQVEKHEEIEMPPAPDLEEIPEIEERMGLREEKIEPPKRSDFGLEEEPENAKIEKKPEQPAKEKVEPVKVIRMPTKPIFVSLQDYDNVNESTRTIKEKLKESWDLMDKMAALRASEEKELESWRMILEDTQRKLAYVDKLIAEGEG